MLNFISNLFLKGQKKEIDKPRPYPGTVMEFVCKGISLHVFLVNGNFDFFLFEGFRDVGDLYDFVKLKEFINSIDTGHDYNASTNY